MKDKEYTDKELTTIYNTANAIPEGKAPPITTQKIFTAMRAMAKLSQLPYDGGTQNDQE